MGDENLNVEQLNAKIASLEEALARMGGAAKGTTDTFIAFQKESERRAKIEKLSAAERKKEVDAYVLQLKKLKDQYKSKIIDEQELQEETAKVERELSYLTKGLDKTTKAHAAAALQEIKNIEIVKEAYVSLAKETKNLAIKLTSQAFSAYSGILKGIQGGANGIQQSASMMSADLDLTNAGIQGMAGMAGTAGTAMMGMGGQARIAGGALMVLGQAAGLASSAFTALEKFKIEFYAKEIEKSFESFKSLSANGVMLGDGLMGLRDAAANTGLSMSTLANVAKKNQTDLSAAGMGATGGFKFMAKTFKDGGKEFKGSLLNLGFDLEEQGELVSKTMAQMRRAGVDPNKADMQSATKDYAANLRLIADITGKDAKGKMEEAKKAATHAAARAKIMKMQRGGDKDAQKRFEAQYAVAAAQGLGEAFMQKFASSDAQGRGGVITDTGYNVANATAGGQLDLGIDKMVQLSKDGSQNMDQFKTALAENTGKMNELFSSEAFATGMEKISEAAIMSGAATATKISEFFIKTVTPALEGIKDGDAGKKAAAEVQDQLNTKSLRQLELNDLIIKGEENRLALERKAAEGVAEYTKLMGKATEKVLELINKMDSPFSFLGGKLMDLALGVAQLAASILPMLMMAKMVGKMKSVGGPPTPPAPPAAPPGTGTIKSPGNLTPEQLAKYKESRAAGVSPADAKASALRGSGISGLAGAEGRITGNPILPTPPAVTAPAGAAAAGAGAVKSGLGKAILGKLPGIGLVLGLADAGARAMRGDFAGAGLAAGAGAAAMLPGLGTAASIGLSGALIAKDMGAFDRPKPSELEQTKPKDDTKDESKGKSEAEIESLTIKETAVKLNESLLAETKKMNELLKKQNALAEEAMILRKRSSDTAESHLRVAEKTLLEVA